MATAPATLAEFEPPVLGRDPDFRKFWAAQGLSAFGARITREGLPLTAVMLSGAEPRQLGVLAALSIGPGVVVSLIAGGYVDRSSRRRILICADLVRAATLLTIPVAAWNDWLSMAQLYGVAAITGAASVLFGIADNAFLPGFVDQRNLLEANTKLNATDSVAEIGGPALAGMLFQVLAAPTAIVFNAFTYVTSAILLGVIRKPEPILESGTESRPIIDALSGVRMTWNNPAARAMLVMAFSGAFFGSFFAALYILYAFEELRLTPVMLGVTIAAGGAGSLAGALAVPRLASRLGTGSAFLRANLGAAVVSLLIPLARGTPEAAMGILVVAQFVGDGMATFAAVIAMTSRQSMFPLAFMGRVGATFHASTGIAGILGALSGGLLGGGIGARYTLSVAVIGLIATALWGFTTPVRHLAK